jgi:hypothetical protein
MITAYFIAVSALLTYLIFVLIVVGIQPSWSHTYYALERVKDWYKYLFQILMVGLMFILAPVVFSLTKGMWWQFVGLFVLFSIALVGAAPRFIAPEGDLENGVHFNGAAVAAIASLAFVVLSAIYLVPVIWYVIPASVIFSYVMYLFTGPKTKLG